jgi:Arc/MetJ-type ribon-helix-helix transcriptional regulator
LVPNGIKVDDVTQHQKFLERGTFQVAVRLSKADYVKIQRLVEAGIYRSAADFLREAVRDKLGSMEVISVQHMDSQKAERMIEEYLIKHPGPSFASEIADELGLEYSVTFKAIHKLLEEGRIRRAKP